MESFFIQDIFRRKIFCRNEIFRIIETHNKNVIFHFFSSLSFFRFSFFFFTENVIRHCDVTVKHNDSF